MRKFNITHAVLSIMATIAVSSASAASVSYTSLAAFNAAVQSSGTDTFSDLNGGSILPTTISRTAGAYSYTASSASALFQGHDANGFLSNDNRGDSIVFSGFSPSITAIGANFFGSTLAGNFLLGESIRIDILESDSDTFTVNLSNTSLSSFWGYVADSSITSLTFTSLGLSLLWPSVDNLTLAQARPVVTDPNPIPEPASLALFGLAALAARVASRRRKV